MYREAFFNGQVRSVREVLSLPESASEAQVAAAMQRQGFRLMTTRTGSDVTPRGRSHLFKATSSEERPASIEEDLAQLRARQSATSTRLDALEAERRGEQLLDLLSSSRRTAAETFDNAVTEYSNRHRVSFVSATHAVRDMFPELYAAATIDGRN